MSHWLVLPFLAQGLFMFVDEFYFHKKRGLPLWEKIGHPLDTLLLLLFYIFLLLAPPSSLHLVIAFTLALTSCFLITKDEWIHHKFCLPMEHWIHSCLFVLHPLVCLAAVALWWFPEPWSHSALTIMTFSTFGFMVHQIVYWNWPLQRKT